MKTIREGKNVSQVAGAGKNSTNPLYSKTTKRKKFGQKNPKLMKWSHVCKVYHFCYYWVPGDLYILRIIFDSFLFLLRQIKFYNIIWCTNVCLDISVCFGCNYLGWHELPNIAKCVRIYFICLFSALFSSLLISFSDVMFHRTINFTQVFRKKF